MSNSSKTVWRIIDLGYSHLRWSDRTIQTLLDNDIQEDTQSFLEIDGLRGEADCGEIVVLAELELLVKSGSRVRRAAYRDCRFPEWRQLQQLSSSPFLSCSTLTSKRGDELWAMTNSGEIRPRVMLSRWLSDLLTPANLIGGENPQTEFDSILWMDTPGCSPLFSAQLYKSIADLPIVKGGAIHSGIAALLGSLPPRIGPNQYGIWGVLDIGVGRASWSLVEVARSASGDRISCRMLSNYGQNWVGEMGLQRALLNTQLSEAQVSWSELGPEDRRAWTQHTKMYARELLRRAWPRYLSELAQSSLDQLPELSGQTMETFKRYQNGTYRAVLAWIYHSLAASRLGPEALKGIWITGVQGLALSAQLRRALSSVNVRVASLYAGHRGAQRILKRVFANQDEVTYQIEEVSAQALLLCDEELGVSRTLFSEQTPLPIVVDAELSPTRGNVSLWLSTYGDEELLLAEHPPIQEQRTLRIYYEGPSLYQVVWVSEGIEQTDDLELWRTTS